MDLNDYLHYPITITKDETGMYNVRCPSVPECITQGETKEECVTMALDALITLASAIGEFGWVFPPSNGEPADAVVDVPPVLALKIMLRNEMTLKKVKSAELARRLGVSPQSLSQTLSPTRRGTSFAALLSAFAALGTPLTVRC